MKALLSQRFLELFIAVGSYLKLHLFLFWQRFDFRIRFDDGSVLLLLLCDSNFNGKIRITSVDKKNQINW